MAGWKKLMLGAGVVAALLLVMLLVLVQVFITPERVREQLQGGLQSTLQREVHLGKVEVGLLRGIRLEQLEIAARDSDQPLLSADRIEISYNLLAMLRGVIQFGRVTIVEPRVRLSRDVNGQLNIADLLGGSDQASASPEPEDQPASGTSQGGAAVVPLLVKEFALQDGTLQFVDRSLNPKSPYLYRLEGLNVRVRDFSLDETFVAQLEARINDAQLKSELEYSFNRGLERLQLSGRRLDLVPLLPYLKENLPGTLHQGLLSADLNLQLEKGLAAVKGQLVLEDIDLTLYLDQPLRWRKARIALDQDLTYRSADRVVDVKSLMLDLNGIRADYTGKLLLGDQPQLAGSARLSVADLRQLDGLLPLEYQEPLSAYSLSGKLDATLQLAGAANQADVLREASINVADLQASFEDLRPALSGDFRLQKDRLQAQGLRIDIRGQQLNANLDARQLFARPELLLGLSGTRLDLDSLFPAADTLEETAPATPAVPASRTAAAETLSLPLDGGVSLKLEKLRYKGLDFSDLDAQLLLKNDNLRLSSLSAGLAGGQLDLAAEAALADKGLPFSGEYKASSVTLAGVADALLPEGKGSISGQLDASGRFSGKGQADDLLKVLHATGHFDLRDGQVQGSPLFAGLARFLTSPELQVVSFNRFAGDYSLKAGQGTINARLDSSRLQMKPKGSFSLAGPLNLSLETYLSPEVIAKSGVGGKGAEWMKDDQGWSLLPLRVKGTYSSPKFRLDSRAARKQVQKGLSRELGKKLKKELGIPDDGKNADDPVQQLMDGALKKLFGK